MLLSQRAVVHRMCRTKRHASAAAQLTLLHRSVRLAWQTPRGCTREQCAISAAAGASCPAFSSLWQWCVAIPRPNGHWQPRRSNEPMGDGRQAAPMSTCFEDRWGGQRRALRSMRPAGPYAMPYGMPPMPAWTHSRGGSNDDKSGYQLVGRLVQRIFWAATLSSNPRSTYSLTAANLSHALGDGSPARPYIRGATVSRLRIVDGLGGGRARCTDFPTASSILHARGMRDMYKAFVGSGVSGELGTHRRKGNERRGGSAAGRDDRPSGMPPQPRVRGDPSVSGLDSPEWKFALRSVLAPEQQPQRILTACQQMLPRILLLSHGRAQLWGAGGTTRKRLRGRLFHSAVRVSVRRQCTLAFLSVPSSAATRSARSPLTARSRRQRLFCTSTPTTSTRPPNATRLSWRIHNQMVCTLRRADGTAAASRSASRQEEAAAAVAIAVIDMVSPTNLHWLVDELRTFRSQLVSSTAHVPRSVRTWAAQQRTQSRKSCSSGQQTVCKRRTLAQPLRTVGRGTTIKLVR